MTIPLKHCTCMYIHNNKAINAFDSWGKKEKMLFSIGKYLIERGGHWPAYKGR